MIIWHKLEKEKQNYTNSSYIGGVPMLPSDFLIPKFSKTNSLMTFFFQIEIPEGFNWAGKIISVFQTTDYSDDDTCIPKLPEPLKGAVLDNSFFENYQSFFRILILDKKDLVYRKDYKHVVAYKNLNFGNEPDNYIPFGNIGQNPIWELDDETPKSYNGKCDVINFLFQTIIDYTFETVDDAPRQKEINFSGTSEKFSDSLVPEYILFTANELYFFGIDDENEKKIYVVPQS